MAKTNYQYEYHPADLRYLTQRLPVITSVAQTLNVSTLDVAAGIIREMNNERFVYPKDMVRWLGQPLKQLQVSDLTDSSIRRHYDRANEMSRLTLENPSYSDRLYNQSFMTSGRATSR